MNIRYFDIHSHLNIKPLSETKDEVIARIREEGVATITVGVDFDTSKNTIGISEMYPDACWATVGLHPADNINEEFNSEKYLELAQHPKVVAIGECGLDYFRLPKNEEEILTIKERQKEIFKKQIAIAIEVNKPLMIHARPSKGSMDAYEDVLEILEAESKKLKAKRLNANFHFFVGDIEIAKRALELGCTMSFDGPITFSRDYDDVIKFLPLESIMAETDAPFAAPEPYRGKTCESWMVKEIYKKIAEIRGEDEEEVRLKLLENSKRFFGIEF